MEEKREVREHKGEHKGGVRFLKIIGGLTIAMLAFAVISQMHDIRRYIKISTM